ncbi:MAG: hypothetical protein AAFR90_14855 [Pseudomonadota bacterium]
MNHHLPRNHPRQLHLLEPTQNTVSMPPDQRKRLVSLIAHLLDQAAHDSEKLTDCQDNTTEAGHE